MSINDWPGKLRREPMLNDPAYTTLVRIAQEVKKFAEQSEGKLVLDFGCGEKPYYTYFNKTKKYIGIDISESPVEKSMADYIVKPEEKLPFSDQYFDLIVCTQVFEHLNNLQFYADELFRVLKPGGKAFISAAFSWEFHPYPYDYWRVTPDGYKRLFKNFNNIKIDVDLDTFSSLMQNFGLGFCRRFENKSQKFRDFFLKKLNKKIYNRTMKQKKKDVRLPANYFVYLEK